MNGSLTDGSVLQTQSTFLQHKNSKEECTYPNAGAAVHALRLPGVRGAKATTLKVEVEASVSNRSRTECMLLLRILLILESVELLCCCLLVDVTRQQ